MSIHEFLCYYPCLTGYMNTSNPFPYNYTAMVESQAPPGLDGSTVIKSDRDKGVSKRSFPGDFRAWEREYDSSMVIPASNFSIQHSHIQNTSSPSTYLPPTFASMTTSPIPISNYTWPAPKYFVSPENQPNIAPLIFNSSHQVVSTSISDTIPETHFVSSSYPTQLSSCTFHTATPTTQQSLNSGFTNENLERKFLNSESNVNISVMKHFVKHQQSNFIAEYAEEFSETKCWAETFYKFEFSEEFVVHHFILSVKEEIREALMLWSPTTLHGSINLA